MSTEAPPAPVEAPVPTPATPAAPSSGISEPWQKDFIASDFSFNHKALERLPDHLKGMAPTLQKYKGLEDMLVGFQNQQVMAGKKGLAPLPADAPPAAFAERKALLDTINGVPADVKGYGITRPPDFPEQHWNQPMADSYAAWAQKNSVSPAAAKELVALQMNTVKGQLAEQAKYETQFWASHEQTFQAAIQRENIPADRASSLVEKGAIALGLDLNNEQTKTFLKGADARMMALKHAIAIGEDKALTSSGNGPTEGGDPAEQARSVMKDPSNPLYGPYWNKEGKYSRSDHDSAVAKVNGWMQLAEDKKAKLAAGGRR